MVNKMSLKTIFLTALLVALPLSVQSGELGFTAVSQRHHVVCGTDIDYNYLAHKKEGYWTGLDADLCRAVAQALLQNTENIKLVSVKPENIGKMLNAGAIDIMLGHSVFSPQIEAMQHIAPIDVMYYDKIVFAARNPIVDAQSMKEYAGEKVCVQDKSAALDYLKQYNSKYALDFTFIKFPHMSAVKEAFYLKRCNLVVGDEIFIKSLINDLHSEDATVLPEEIALVEVKSYTAANNNYFNAAIRSVFNALKYASVLGMNPNNIETFKFDTTPAVQNMLGNNPNIWKELKISPDWLVPYIQKFGTYTDIIDRNIGYGSPLELDMSRNLPYARGGLLSVVPML